MIIFIKKNTTKEEMEPLLTYLNELEISTVLTIHDDYDILHLSGEITQIDCKTIALFPCVERLSVVDIEEKKEKSHLSVDVNGIKFGNNEKIVVIAGPCSVESYEQIDRIAGFVSNHGAKMLRGGAYKPRTSPYSFQGLKTQGIEYLKQIKKQYNIPIVSEITSVEQIEEFINDVDLIQVGARNMQNYELLKALGQINKPILLKRHFGATINEWLLAAEYIIAKGNKQVILCERGIRSFEPLTRFSLDLSVIPLVKKLSNLPIIVDPSHAAGNYELVESLALAAIAAKADGLIIEVHDNPQVALSDGGQSLKLKNFAMLMEKIEKVANAIGRDVL